MLRAVVDPRIGSRSQGDLTARDRVLLNHGAGEVLPRTLDDHGDGSGTRKVVGHLAVALVHDGVALGVERGAVGVLDLGHPLVRRTVVDNVLGIAHDHAPVATFFAILFVDGLLGNAQGAERLGDGVVLLERGAVIPIDGVRVLALASIGLGAGGGEREGLAVGQPLVGASRGKLLTVVDLGRIGRRYRKRSGIDEQVVVRLGDLEAGGDVLALGVPDDEVIGRGLNALTIVLGVVDILYAGVGGSGLERIALGQRAHRNGSTMRGSVVGIGAAGGGDHDLVFGLRNRQGTERLGDGVVSLLGSAALPIDRVGVLTPANLLLLAGDPEGRTLLADKAGDIALGGQLFAVVHAVGALGLNGQRGRRDVVSTYNSATVVALAGDGDGDGAGVLGVLGVRNLVILVELERIVTVLDDNRLLLAPAVVDDIFGLAHVHADSIDRARGDR